MENKLTEYENKFVELLRKSPKSKQEVAEMEKYGDLFVKELNYEVRELSKEMKEAGSKYSDPWDLVNTKDSYPELIDILLKHLEKNYHDRNKEGIIRSLSVREAAGKATPLLIQEYYKTPREKNNLRWVIGNSVFTTITKSGIESIIPIVLDKRNGMSREMFIKALGKIKNDKSEKALIELLEDDQDEMLQYVIETLGKLKSQKAKSKIENLLHHPNEKIQSVAKKALKKIDTV